MKKILLVAFAAFLVFGSSDISYGYEGNTQDNYLMSVQETINEKEIYFQRENRNFWSSSDSLLPSLESVGESFWVKGLFLKQSAACQSCSVTTKVNGNELSCSVSCKDGQTPVCLPAEFGVRPSPTCYCK